MLGYLSLNSTYWAQMKAENPKMSLHVPIAASKLELEASKRKRAFFLRHPVSMLYLCGNSGMLNAPSAHACFDSCHDMRLCCHLLGLGVPFHYSHPHPYTHTQSHPQSHPHSHPQSLHLLDVGNVGKLMGKG